MGVIKPTATGTLSKRPLCELLVYLLSRKLSGTLVLEEPTHLKHALLFSDGVLIKSKVVSAETRFGDVARSLDVVDDEAIGRAMSVQDGTLIGERLVAQGALERPALERVLVTQLFRQVTWLARLDGEIAYGYYEQQDFLQKWAGEPLGVDPLALIASAAFARPPRERIEQACAGLHDSLLRLHPWARVQRFGLGPKQRVVIDVLRAKPQSLAELAATGLLPAADLHTLLYILIITAHLDVGTVPLGVVLDEVPQSATTTAAGVQTAAAAEYRRRSSGKLRVPRGASGAAPPPSLRAAAAAVAAATFTLTREQIEAKLAVLDTADHYQLLEVEPDVTPVQLGAAFPVIARRWHPDRLPAELAEHKESVMRIFSRLTEVHRTLSDPELRQAYDAERAGSAQEAEEQEQVQRVLAAVSAFRKAEVLLKKRDLAGAEELAELAASNDPDQPEYDALHAWIQARRVQTAHGDLAPYVKRLDEAVKRQTNNVRIHYYRACVLKLAGKNAEALREFRHVHEADPNNVEAARELRLHEMRRHSQPPEESDTASRGLLNRFFKR
jgi:tetratricopeptide (TPR) repeat protein